MDSSSPSPSSSSPRINHAIPSNMYPSPPTMRKFDGSPPIGRKADSDEKKRSRGRPPLPKGLKCEKCNTTDTPEWRVGENGPHTLCNACGLQFAKKKKMEQESRARHSIRNLLNGDGDGVATLEQVMQDYVLVGSPRASSPSTSSPRSSVSSPRSPLLSASNTTSPRGFESSSSSSGSHIHIHYHHHPYHIGSGSPTSPPPLRSIYTKMPPKSPSMPSFPSESLPHLNRSSSCASLLKTTSTTPTPIATTPDSELSNVQLPSSFSNSNFQLTSSSSSANSFTLTSSSNSSIPSLASSSSFSSMDFSLASPVQQQQQQQQQQQPGCPSPIGLQTAALSLSNLSISPHTSFTFNAPFKFESSSVYKEGSN